LSAGSRGPALGPSRRPSRNPRILGAWTRSALCSRWAATRGRYRPRRIQPTGAWRAGPSRRSIGSTRPGFASAVATRAVIDIWPTWWSGGRLVQRGAQPPPTRRFRPPGSSWRPPPDLHFPRDPAASGPRP